MSGKSPVAASEQQKVELRRLAASRERGQADRTRGLCHVALPWARSVGASGIVRPQRLPRWSDAERAGPTAFGGFEDEARAGEELIETYASRH
jgi:hypothetical protein